MSVNEKQLDEMLTRLFVNAYKIEERAVSELAGHDLSISELHIIKEIPDDIPKTMSVVAQGLRISVGALTIAMNKLVAKGYVKRFRGKTDRRTMKVILTSKGKDAYQKHEEFHKAMIDSAVSILTPEERVALQKAVEKLDDYFLEEEKKLSDE